jgi:hypothetical protein
VVTLVVVGISIALHFDSRKANSHTRKVAKGKQFILAITTQISDKYKKFALNNQPQFRHFGNPKKYTIGTH